MSNQSQFDDATLEAKLKHDANAIDGTVTPQLRKNIMQTIQQNPETVSNPIVQIKRTLPFAVAASLVVTLVVLLTQWQSPKEDYTNNGITQSSTTQVPSINKNEPQSIQISQQLNNEYNAIVSDVEKLKSKLMKL